jgi:hypothetical protein
LPVGLDQVRAPERKAEALQPMRVGSKAEPARQHPHFVRIEIFRRRKPAREREFQGAPAGKAGEDAIMAQPPDFGAFAQPRAENLILIAIEPSFQIDRSQHAPSAFRESRDWRA